MLRSLRFRLTFWFVLSLAVVQAASGFLWHWYLETELERQMQERLRLVSQDVEDFFSAGMVGVGRLSPADCRNLNRFLRKRNWNELISIRSRFGTVVCRSDNLGRSILPITRSGRETLRHGGERFERLQAQPFLRHILISRQMRLPGANSPLLLQVAADTDPGLGPLEQLRVMLFTLSPLALLAVAVGGWLIAGRALVPVTRMAREIRDIRADNLRRRLPVPDSGDELAELAESFNAMLERLEDSFRRIRQFSGDASHELRTPLTILKGETEVALRWAKSVDEFRDVVASNLEEIQRMERIIDNLLLLSKSDSGELPLEIKPFSLSDLVQATFLQMRPQAEERGLVLSFDFDVDREVVIQGDELRLRQMLLNLVTNAVKYTPEGGQVEIYLSVQQEQAVLTVSDTGIGIASEHLPHIFDRFYRTDQARNREEGGAGLGLAIVKWVVEAHDGRIEVASTPDQGTRFTVHLPLGGPEQVRRKAVRGNDT
ncbi:MAG: ATP-binding protein [Geothermobacteraceae bacterium]